MVRGGYGRAYFLWKIIKVKRMIEFVLEAFYCPWFFMLPAGNKQPESPDSFMPGASLVDIAGLSCHFRPMLNFVPDIL